MNRLIKKLVITQVFESDKQLLLESIINSLKYKLI